MVGAEEVCELMNDITRKQENTVKLAIDGSNLGRFSRVLSAYQADLVVMSIELYGQTGVNKLVSVDSFPANQSRIRPM